MKTFVISAVTYNRAHQINILNTMINTILDNFPDFKLIVMTNKKGKIKNTKHALNLTLR